MMRSWIVALAVAAGCPAVMQAADTQPAGNLPVVNGQGSLVIIGGALRFTEMSVWSTIVDLAGGKGAKIAVFPTASSQPMASGERIVQLLKSLGAEAFVVPVGVMNIEQDYQKVVHDAEWVARVKSATGVFFTGGSQARITQALLGKDGTQTPVLEAIWDVYNRGGVVAGTSAGAAMMSKTMFSNPQSVLGTMQKGVRMGVEIDRGLGFLDGSWFVEQHCLARGRFARALVAMHTAGIKYGIGIEEDTAVVVKHGTDLSVCGYKGVLVFDVSEAKRDAEINGFNLQNVKMSYLDRGDSINLKTLEVTPSELKKENPKIDPQADGFKPWGRKPIFTNDMLGNCVVSSVMSQVLTHEKGEATGLAYDGNAARTGQEAEGFEFRLYRGKDTCGWHTDDEGYDSYTVSNVRLDVEPIAISAPLYSYVKPRPVNPEAGRPTQTASNQPVEPTPMVITPVSASTTAAKVETAPAAQK
jgi:cyanophycinase